LRPASGNAQAWLVVLAGVCAAVHVGKLAPAITALQAALDLSLLQAGWLLSLVQAAGMVLGLVLGAATDSLGAKRSIVLGLWLLALASALGGSAHSVAVLMALRALEGFGFLLVVLPAPGWIRQSVDAQRVQSMLGVWGAYMPLATALALLTGPLCIGAWGWRGWWWALAGLTAVVALVVMAWLRPLPTLAQPGALRNAEAGSRVKSGVESAARSGARSGAKPLPNSWRNSWASSWRSPWTSSWPRSWANFCTRFWTSFWTRLSTGSWMARLRRTLSAPGPWWLAMSFACYSAQWLAVIGFLPSIVQAAGYSAVATGVTTALVAAANIVGNLSAGRAMQRGVAPALLLRIGFVALAVAALLAFGASGASPAAGASDPGPWLPPGARFAAVLLFSGLGGLIPATLFVLAVQRAPSADTVSTTVGWMQQWSSLGQFAGPPLVAAVATAAGGWQFTWLATGALCMLGLLLAARLSTRPGLDR